MTNKKSAFMRVLCLLSFFVALCLCVSCSGEIEPLPEDDEPAPTEGRQIVLAAYSSDPLDPYRAETMQNRHLLALCYEPLFIIDDEWRAEPCLAQSFSSSGRVLTVQLRSDAEFWDGSAVTAGDVVYSYDAARDSGGYGDIFGFIENVEAIDDDTLSFTFVSDADNNVNFLTVPIVKAQDQAGEFSVGSGMYFLRRVPDGEGECIKLYRNPRHRDADSVTLEDIEVAYVDSYEELMYGLNYGLISALCVDLENGVTMYKNNIELVSYTTNRMVYLYLNPDRAYFSDRVNVSMALSYLIDRSYVSDRILSASGTAVWYPFNPSWYVVEQADLNPNIYDESLARQYFYDARWYVSSPAQDTSPQTGNAAGSYQWYGTDISLNIIVTNDDPCKYLTAEYLRDSLVALGISAEVSRLSGPDYERAFADGDYDICVTEAQISADMDITCVLSELGYTADEEFYGQIYSFNHGSLDLRDFLSAFQSRMPFIPLYFVNGAVALSNGGGGISQPCVSNAYSGIEKW